MSRQDTLVSITVIWIVGMFLFAVMPFSGDVKTKLHQPIIIPSIQSLPDVSDKPIVSKENRKRLEMLNVIVQIEELFSLGSGVLVGKHNLDDETFEYFVITNHHVVVDREISVLKSVDGLRGIVDFELQDIGCKVTVFNNNATERAIYDADVVIESLEDDLAVVRFTTTDDIKDIAKIATIDMMLDVGFFDEVYAVGCQLGRRPIPTRGIISGIYNSESFIGFSHTAQITPGSSGGGLFKQYDEHFYLIGMPSMVSSYNFQIISHYGYAVSTSVLQKFLCANNMDFLLSEMCEEEQISE